MSGRTYVDDLDRAILDLQSVSPTAHDVSKKLRVSRNASASPLCRLPLDVLSPILFLLVLSEQEQPYVWSTRCLPEIGTKWVEAVNVCTHVRTIALACPILWTYIYLGHRNVEWVDLCIARSKSHCLTVSCVHSRFSPRLHIQKAQLRALLPRAEDLRIVVDWPSNKDEFQEVAAMLDSPMPRSRFMMHWRPDDAHAITLTPHFAGGFVHLLTRLALRNVMIPEDVPIFGSLQDLSLDRIIVESRPARLLDLIRQASQLRSLRLRTIEYTKVDPDVEPISLPHLEMVVVNASYIWIVVLAALLPIPQQRSHMIVDNNWLHLHDTDPSVVTLCSQRNERIHQFLRIGSAPAPTLLLEITSQIVRITARFAGDSDESPHPELTFEERTSEPATPFFPFVEEMHLASGTVSNILQDLEDASFGVVLPILKRLVILNGHSHIDLLSPWLQKRANEGQRLAVVEVRVDGRIISSMVDLLSVWATKVRAKYWAEKVLWNGSGSIPETFVSLLSHLALHELNSNIERKTRRRQLHMSSGKYRDDRTVAVVFDSLARLGTKNR
jgi:hypothetical protein